jgi:hypothetical protein
MMMVATPCFGQKVSPLVKYGKWGALGVSLAFNAMAFRTHDRAQSAFRHLEGYCFPDPTRCETGPGGSYKDPVSERYYQQSLSYDRQTRVRLVAGETALLGTIALFVWEMSQPKGPPENIPFRPEVSTHDGVTHVGLRVAF